MKPKSTPSKNLQQLRQLAQEIKDRFHQSHTEASDWFGKQSLKVSDLRKQSQQLLTAASLAGSVMASSNVDAKILESLQLKNDQDAQLLSHISKEEYATVMDKMRSFTLMGAGHLPQEDELYLEQQLTDMLGFEVTTQLDGHRLNHSMGIMGGEQHLYRFPGDSLTQHDAYLESGIAPARGAFGWFTETGELDSLSIEREKYYFAVQTLYLPDWNSNYQELKPWYKFRKMIVINPADELAVVGVVGDAGPALWVKKQYGGSPEVIREGKIWSPAAKGRVILLFVNDPEDKIPLGVINLQDLQPKLG